MKLKMPKMNTKNFSDNRLIATLMIVATVVVSLSFVFSKKWIGDITFNNKVIGAKNDVNATLEQNVAALDELKVNYDFLLENGPDPAAIFRALPVEVDNAGIGKEFEAMAASSGTQVIDVSLAIQPEQVPASGAPSPQEATYQVSVTGSYKNLKKLLSNIEKSLIPIRVNTATFGGADPEVTLELDITTFYQPRTVVGDETEVITDEN